jgi:uncharacterized protein (DUF1810 family)
VHPIRPFLIKSKAGWLRSGVADTPLKSLCIPNDFDANGFDGTEETVLKAPRGEERAQAHALDVVHLSEIDGLGFSSAARRYGIKNADEARAYLAHPILGSRLLACAEAAVANAGSNAT